MNQLEEDLNITHGQKKSLCPLLGKGYCVVFHRQLYHIRQSMTFFLHFEIKYGLRRCMWVPG